MSWSNNSVNLSTPHTNPDTSMLALYKETVEFERQIGIIIPTIFAIVIFSGLVGNMLVIMVVALNPQMRNSTNTLIVSLACSDLFFLIVCVPFTAADYALPVWAFATWWCGVLNYLQFVSAYGSVWTLCLMALDRFLAVVFPIKSLTLRTPKNTATLTALLWLFIVVFCIPVILENKIFTYTFIVEQRSTCTYLAHATRNGTSGQVQLYYFSFNVFGYLLPLTISLSLYAVFLRKLWSMRRPGTKVGTKNDEGLKAKRKVTWMVTGVIVTFMVCWLPLNICFFITGIMYPGGIRSKFFVGFQIFAQALAYTNSCLNPMLYAFLSENFRRGFLKIIGFVSITFRCSRIESDRRSFQPSPLKKISSTSPPCENIQLTAKDSENDGRCANNAGTNFSPIVSPSPKTPRKHSYYLTVDNPSDGSAKSSKSLNPWRHNRKGTKARFFPNRRLLELSRVEVSVFQPEADESAV